MATSKKEINGFKMVTIQKIVNSLVMWVGYYHDGMEDGRKVDLVISDGNKKIGRCMNVSLAPILTCKRCEKCMYYCYDIKACLQYENVRKARAKNTALFNYSREEFFRQLWERMARKRKNKFLRFHVSGEIVDTAHFNLMVETARRFPDFTIWTYTKNYDAVNEWIAAHGSIPENFSVMFSEWKGVPIDNPYNMPVFRCAFTDADRIGFHCPGNCDICKEKHCGCIAGQSAWVDLH